MTVLFYSVGEFPAVDDQCPCGASVADCDGCLGEICEDCQGNLLHPEDACICDPEEAADAADGGEERSDEAYDFSGGEAVDVLVMFAERALVALLSIAEDVDAPEEYRITAAGEVLDYHTDLLR